MSALISSVTATIASGQSLSSGVLLGDKTPVAIQMPAAWDAADLTFQVSDDDGDTWQELLDDTGAAIAISGPGATERLNLAAGLFSSAVLLKVRSGTSSVAVNQTADRAIVVLARLLFPRR